MKGILILTLCLPFLFSGCSLLPRVGSGVKAKPAIVSTQSQESKVYREDGYEEVAGKAKKFSKSYREFNKSKEKTTPKKTMMERVGSWISGLGIVTFILIAAGLFFAPTVTISLLWSAKKRIGRALKAVVHAVKDTQADQEERLHNALKDRTNRETRIEIDKIKSKL